MSIFGWWYPPGAANDPNAPYNQTDDIPCSVCGEPIDDCHCPECPVCEAPGEAMCYDRHGRAWHGLERSLEQMQSFARAQRRWAAEAAAEEWGRLQDDHWQVVYDLERGYDDQT